MIIKDKNKLKSKAKSKILVLGLITLFVLVGLFGSMAKASAQTAPANTVESGSSGGKTIAHYENNKTPPPVCFGMSLSGLSLDVPTCLLNVSQIIFFSIPAFLLWFVSYVFNFIIYLALGAAIYSDPFVSSAWAIARDLANLFFILVLLYISIKLILGLGGSEVKKMIARVVIMAMLINFSMFFTKVVIDSSNILALIFYNKIGTLIKNPDRSEKTYDKISEEKDLAGGLIGEFNPAKISGKDFANQATKVFKDNASSALAATTVGVLLIPVMISLVSFGGIIMLFVIYIFLTIIIAFFSRIVELLVLIIFSPIAFVSFSVPFLEKYQYIGWHDWLSRLIKSAFMAPIFMFFLYIIFTLINSKILNRVVNLKTTDIDSPAGLIKMILGIVFSLGFIMTLLWMAIQFAKKSSGKVGEMAQKVMVGTAKVVGTAVAAVATEGASLAATSAIGGSASKTLGDQALKDRALSGDLGAQRKLQRAERLATTKIDFRSPMKTIKGLTGTSMPSAEGGYKGIVGREAEKYEKESKLYKTTETNDQVEKRTTEERKAYDEEKAYAENDARKAGKTFDEADYEKKNGPAPEVYTTAEGFNNARMKAFQKTLGTRLDWGFGKEAGKEKFSKELEKEFKKMGDIQERIAQTEESLAKHVEKIAGAKKFTIEGKVEDLMRIKMDKNGNPVKDKNGNEVEEIDQSKVTFNLGLMEASAIDINSQIKALNKAAAKNPGGTPTQAQKDAKKKLRDDLAIVFATTNNLSDLKTVEEKKLNTENQLYNLRGTRENIKGGGAGGGGGGGGHGGGGSGGGGHH